MASRPRAVLIALIALVATGILAAAAIAAPPTTETTNVKNQVETFIDVIPSCENADPCEDHAHVQPRRARDRVRGRTGAWDVHADRHVRREAARSGWARRVGQGHDLGGFNDNGKAVTSTFTFNVTGRYSDGTKIDVHTVDHFNARPDGTENFFSRCND
jgi:hypothetical protein